MMEVFLVAFPKMSLKGRETLLENLCTPPEEVRRESDALAVPASFRIGNRSRFFA